MPGPEARCPRCGDSWKVTGLVLVVGLVLWLAWPSGKPAPYDPPARARQHVAFTACLLTRPSGLSDPQVRRTTGRAGGRSRTLALLRVQRGEACRSLRERLDLVPSLPEGAVRYGAERDVDLVGMDALVETGGWPAADAARVEYSIHAGSRAEAESVHIGARADTRVPVFMIPPTAGGGGRV
jgi:hypothetical protein